MNSVALQYIVALNLIRILLSVRLIPFFIYYLFQLKRFNDVTVCELSRAEWKMWNMFSEN